VEIDTCCPSVHVYRIPPKDKFRNQSSEIVQYPETLEKQKNKKKIKPRLWSVGRTQASVMMVTAARS
jgi:hypothetical protein